ncbi:MAG TPA: MarR family transcriptional regulator [Symbiobacteriaceae bacterium]|jgi:DNA-binding MarR family transcriptional regulator
MDYAHAGSLLREVARLYIQSQRDTLSCCGPTNASECKVLTELGGGTPLTIAELARRLDVDKGWVSRVAEGLAQEGLVAKVPGTVDRRRVFIGLTAAGQERHAALNAALNGHALALLGRVPAEQQATVVEILEMLRAALREGYCSPRLTQLDDAP